MKPDPFWLTKPQAAELCGLSTRQFSDVVPPKLDKSAVRGAGATLRFHAPAVVKALCDYRVDQAKPIDGDPLLGVDAGDSPELARYRRLKGDEVELNLSERRAMLVRMDKVLEALGPSLAAARGAGDRLRRQFGNEAGDIFNEFVDEWMAAAAKLVETTEQT